MKSLNCEPTDIAARQAKRELCVPCATVGGHTSTCPTLKPLESPQEMLCPLCHKPMHLEYGENGQDVWCHANSEDHYECERLREPKPAHIDTTEPVVIRPELQAVSIPLSSAAHCCDCDSIVNRLDKCPDCGSRSLICLARVLNREHA